LVRDRARIAKELRVTFAANPTPQRPVKVVCLPDVHAGAFQEFVAHGLLETEFAPRERAGVIAPAKLDAVRARVHDTAHPSQPPFARLGTRRRTDRSMQILQVL